MTYHMEPVSHNLGRNSSDYLVEIEDSIELM